MLIIEPDHVHLWLTFPDEIQDTCLLEQYVAMLSPQERVQLARFHFARDRHRYLLTRACIRTVLSKYAAIEPARWEFVSSAHGRPGIANHGENIESLSFNISHTAGLILVGVTRRNELGVDVESLSARAAPVDIARSYFAPTECEMLQATPLSSRADMFLRLWTLKESYVKARGLGLAMPLDQFSFRIGSNSELEFTTDPSMDDLAERWHFMQFRIRTDFVAAVCARRLPGVAQTYSARAIIPLARDCAFECECVAASSKYSGSMPTRATSP